MPPNDKDLEILCRYVLPSMINDYAVATEIDHEEICAMIGVEVLSNAQIATIAETMLTQNIMVIRRPASLIFSEISRRSSSRNDRKSARALLHLFQEAYTLGLAQELQQFIGSDDVSPITLEELSSLQLTQRCLRVERLNDGPTFRLSDTEGRDLGIQIEPYHDKFVIVRAQEAASLIDVLAKAVSLASAIPESERGPLPPSEEELLSILERVGSNQGELTNSNSHRDHFHDWSTD